MRRSLLALISAALVPVLGACSSDATVADPTTTSRPTSSSPTTTTAPAPTTASTSASAPDLVLRGDGLGSAALGAAPDEAVAAVTAGLGAPSADTGWQSSFSSYGTCPGTEVRGVEWDHLVLLFTDGDTPYGSGRHLFAWRLTGAPPAIGTATGFGYRATAADAEDLYPGRVETVPAAEPFPSFLEIDADGGTITAYLDDADVVRNLEAGVSCGE